ncbi:transmembrane protein 26-like [Haliotis rufescens]|uniref:transmembrane protein 26-like n=1 Tax=Haliotis rufescens TaxID=6454 RepID=UPI001EAFF84C|nr:transmembrane protein 26-like [Haliotis rufescens]
MMATMNIIKAVTVRLVLFLHTIVAIWRVTDVWQNDQFWLLTLATVPFIIEGIYVVVKKEGIEWKWLCPCFLFFLMSTMPAIWLLEISRQGTFATTNITAVTDIAIAGVRVPIRLTPDTWVLIIEESLLYLMILGRWLLPRGEVSREQLSQLLFSFLAIASDIMELFSLFDEDVVRGSIVITYVLLSVWTWSILQFTLVLTIYNRPRRARVVEKTTSILIEHKEGVKLEIIAIFISMLMQDGPFLCLRLFCMLQFQLFTYSVVFFTAKNFLVILLLVYRLSILCSENYCKGGKKGDKLDEHDELEMKNGKHPLNHTTFVAVNEGYHGDKNNGGAVRQRSRPTSEGASSIDSLNTLGFRVSHQGETDVDKERLSLRVSSGESVSIRSEGEEVDRFPEPMQQSSGEETILKKADSLESCHL